MAAYDVHQHLLPPTLVEALRARREPPRIAGGSLELAEGTFPFDERDHDLGERIALLDRDEIDIAIVSLAPTMETEGKQELEDAYNEGIRDVVAEAGGRLRAFAAGTCLDGFAGVCVSAQALMGGLGSLPGELVRTGQVLFVHPGPPGAPPAGAPLWWTAVVDYPAQMQAAYYAWLDDDVAGHPDLDVVFAVLAGGAPVQLERLRSRGGDPERASHTRTHLDVASYGARALELCLTALGPDRLVYGSDRPVVDAAPTLDALAGLGPDVLDTVRSDNPERLLG
jgi:predicted TIM-barrel fold metal-dependent hydrolase